MPSFFVFYILIYLRLGFVLLVGLRRRSADFDTARTISVDGEQEEPGVVGGAFSDKRKGFAIGGGRLLCQHAQRYLHLRLSREHAQRHGRSPFLIPKQQRLFII